MVGVDEQLIYGLAGTDRYVIIYMKEPHLPSERFMDGDPDFSAIHEQLPAGRPYN